MHSIINQKGGEYKPELTKKTQQPFFRSEIKLNNKKSFQNVLN